MNRRLVLVALLPFAAACTSTEISTGPRDPANPGAKTTPLPNAGEAFAPEFDPLAGGEKSSAPAGHHDHGTMAVPAQPQSHDHGSDQSAVRYTCSMHPQVVKDQPGKCPICGMKLVPMQPKPPASEGPEKK